MIVLSEPFINVGLKVSKCGVELLSEKNGVTLILHSSVKSFTNTISLRVIGLGF